MDTRLVLTVLFVTLSWLSVGTHAVNTTTSNTTVENLGTPLSRTACGTQALCAAVPADCDPSSGSCFFLQAKQTSGNNFEFGLSGESDGYIAATLSPDATLGGNDTTYVCANNNGVVKFFATVLNNGTLTVKPLNVNSVKGSVNGRKIQCTFAATVPDTPTRAPAKFAVAISTGSFNNATGTLGAPVPKLKSAIVDLANATATVTNATTAPAPALMQNTTVENLGTPLSRTGCGTQALCAAEPADCDPSSGSCFFLQAKQTSGNNFEFGLSGESDGYIAATLSPDATLGGNDTTYVCANNNGVVKFFATVLDNGSLTVKPLNVNSVKGSVNGRKIQCTFAATVPDTPTRAPAKFAVAISSGSFNNVTNALGAPVPKLKSAIVDLANATATVTNATTAPAPALMQNTTVENLGTPLSRTACGTQALCAAEPADCDPSSGSCFFLQAKQTSGNNFEFGLSGESDGYIAATLSPDATLGGNDTTYVCANNNGVVKFFATVLNNGVLTVKPLNVNSVKGSVNGRKIQCTFAATVPGTPTRAPAKFAVAISTGSFNNVTNALGAPVPKLKSAIVDLANATATVTNATTTPAPALMQNTTVENLGTPLSRTACGTQALCAAEPADCDPSSGSCFFLQAKQTSGNNFEFGLSGESDGYMAATLSPDATLGGNDTTYVCANNNGVVKFFATVLNNGVLTVKPLNVNSVKGSVNGRKIQCTFAATVPDTSTRAPAKFAVAISSGSFNNATNALGAPVSVLKTAVVDLTNTTATVTNAINATNTTTTPTTTPAPTPAPTTTGHAITLRQSLTQAVLITVGVVGLTLL